MLTSLWDPQPASQQLQEALTRTAAGSAMWRPLVGRRAALWIAAVGTVCGSTGRAAWGDWPPGLPRVTPQAVRVGASIRRKEPRAGASRAGRTRVTW
jgi:hypothetical protein